MSVLTRYLEPVTEDVELDPLTVPAAGDAVQRIAWPAYVYPTLSGADGNYWDQALKYVPTVEIVIANISSGPGTTVGSDYTTAITKARASGATVIGYVDTSFAARSQSAVLADVDMWRALYDVDGIFFDQASVSGGDVGYYQTIYDYVKAAFPLDTRRLVVINPGVPTIEAYMACADVVVNAEGDPTTYRARTAAAWERNYPARRFFHIVHSITSQTELREMIDLSCTNRAGYVYFTDDVMANPFDTVPVNPFWSEQVATIARGTEQAPFDVPTATIRGDNGLSALRLRGRKTTTGAPATGTWVAGDLIIDSAGAWHVCTASGSPGTWT